MEPRLKLNVCLLNDASVTAIFELMYIRGLVRHKNSTCVNICRFNDTLAFKSLLLFNF